MPQSTCAAATTYGFCSTWDCVIGTLDHWQTMITGLLAVSAAWFALRAAKGQLKAAEGQLATAKRQLDDQRNQVNRDRAGRLRAARAALPAVLGSICAYAEETALTLDREWPSSARMFPEDTAEDAALIVGSNLPAFPPEALPVLERLVELSDDNDISKAIEGILREVQVFTARTRKVRKGRSLHAGELAEAILQAAVIYARTERLYGYARRHSEEVDAEPLWDRVFAALSLFNLSQNDRIMERASRQRARGLPPGAADTSPPKLHLGSDGEDFPNT